MKVVDCKEFISDCYKLSPTALISPMRDGKLACPSYEWLEGPFSEFVRDNMQHYVTEKFDCDDFALKTVVLGTEALNATDSLIGCGHSIGIAYAFINGELNGVRDGNHATNIVRLDDGRVVFYEPQNQKIEFAESVVENGTVKPYFFFL